MALPGFNLTPLGYGAFKIGRNQNVKYAEAYDLPDEGAVERLLNGVLDLGVRYIDTAPAYGCSEERIGRAIGHRSDEFALSTKVGETFADGRSVYDFSADATRTSVECSLQRLKRDVLDLVFIHSNRDEFDVLQRTDVVPTLHALRDQGLIKAIGFSGYTADGLVAALAWADAVMLEYHLDDRSLAAVIDKAAAGGAAVVVKKGLASGRLDPDAAVPFVLSNPGVTSLVVGGLSLAHLEANVRLAGQVRRQTGPSLAGTPPATTP
ncbi:MAG: aldo/keto reductase [bacterium]|nr:aldo/keto reductase [bacterium]